MVYYHSFFTKTLFSLGLGALIGLEREKNKKLAGIRTFMLVTLLGTLSKILSEDFGSFFIALPIIIVGALIFESYKEHAEKQKEFGLTTPVSFVIAFLIGVLVGQSLYFEAASIAIMITGVLTLKNPLHNISEILTEEEIFSGVEFLISTVVLLPLLPQEAVDPWGLFVPYEMWLFAVAVLSISFFGYIAARIFGGKKSLLISGIIGGFTSSTASTSFVSHLVKNKPEIEKEAVSSIVTASSLRFVRTLILVSLISSELGLILFRPFIAMFGAGIILAFYLYETSSSHKFKEPPFTSPFALRPALAFLLFYVATIAVVEFASSYFGDAGLYFVSFISGVGSVNPLALALTKLYLKEQLSGITALNALFIASTSDIFFKIAVSRIFGTDSFFRKSLFYLSIIFLSGLFMLLV